MDIENFGNSTMPNDFNGPLTPKNQNEAVN